MHCIPYANLLGGCVRGVEEIKNQTEPNKKKTLHTPVFLGRKTGVTVQGDCTESTLFCAKDEQRNNLPRAVYIYICITNQTASFSHTTGLRF